MRQFILKLARICGHLHHHVITSRISFYLSTIKREFNTGWLMSEFKSFGKNSIIDRPLTIRGAKYISIGKNVLIGRRVVLTAFDAYLNKKFTPEIIISDDVEIGDDSHITCLNNIYIGKGVLTGKKILITDNAHGLFIESDLAIEPKNRIPVSKGAVVIEDYVWIGEKASIMPGVTVGRGAIIGANAVVTKNIPPYSIAAGCPATIVKQLSKHDCCHSVKKK